MGRQPPIRRSVPRGCSWAGASIFTTTRGVGGRSRYLARRGYESEVAYQAVRLAERRAISTPESRAA